MDIARVLNVLDNHGINTRLTPQGWEMYEEWTHAGQPCGRWMPIITDYINLVRWLGY